MRQLKEGNLSTDHDQIDTAAGFVGASHGSPRKPWASPRVIVTQLARDTATGIKTSHSTIDFKFGATTGFFS
jgi:hypothetical protein